LIINHNIASFLLFIYSSCSKIKRPADLPDPAPSRNERTAIDIDMPTFDQTTTAATAAVSDAKIRNDIPVAIPGTKGMYAYAFMYWGIDPSITKSYRKGLAHIALSATLLHGPYKSQDEVLAIIRMSPAYPNDRLPEEDEAVLQENCVHVHYINPSDPENQIPSWNLTDKIVNQYHKLLQKCYLCRLVQYRRIFYLDADVMLHRNLDYCMEFSDQGIFGEQVMISGHTGTQYSIIHVIYVSSLPMLACPTGFFRQGPLVTNSHFRTLVIQNQQMVALLSSLLVSPNGNKLEPSSWSGGL
jgi:hypothetical protein